MRNLFVYGSLMFDEVWDKLIKNRYKKLEAELHDYQRFCVRGVAYPGLVKAQYELTQGVLILNLKPRDILLLDRFEGEYYQRITVNVYVNQTPHKADVYIFKNRYRHRLSRTNWNADMFRDKYLAIFLARYAGFIKKNSS